MEVEHRTRASRVSKSQRSYTDVLILPFRGLKKIHRCTGDSPAELCTFFSSKIDERTHCSYCVQIPYRKCTRGMLICPPADTEHE